MTPPRRLRITARALALIFPFLLPPPSLPAAQPPGFAALMRTAQTLDARNENEQALKILREAEALDPEDPELLRLLAKQLSGLVEEAPDKKEKLQLARESVGYATRSVEAAPHSADARLGLAICQGRLALYESPSRRFQLAKDIKANTEAALLLDPKHDYAWHVLGRWHHEMATLHPALRIIAETIFGKFPDTSLDRAIECLEKAVVLQPSRVAHHIELGRAFLAAGRIEEGKNEIEKGLRLPVREKDDEQTKNRGRQALSSL